ncbi:MAG: ABC transporter ATP-binding protein [Thaumarchaeota archaeon]|nr:ABC transporter ATP-binding protein [Nitrososphaerota archaeon]
MKGIKIEGVSKQYISGNTLKVIDNIDLSINPNTFTTIIGPSGCGKSTLLQIVAGIIKADTGRVIIDGQEINSPRPDIISMVFQDPALFPWRNVLQNVEFPLELKGVNKTERRRTANKYLSLVGLSDFVTYYPNQLSGGMQQRVNLARALVTQPQILLMDEPFGALDEQTRQKMAMELVRIWQQTGVTILFVTHSLVEAAYLSDRVIVLSHRPATVRAIIDIDLPRPREIEDPTLVGVRKQMWSLLSRERE